VINTRIEASGAPRPSRTALCTACKHSRTCRSAAATLSPRATVNPEPSKNAHPHCRDNVNAVVLKAGTTRSNCIFPTHPDTETAAMAFP
jgi:hypothetical protein